jgi:hypothetical protein
MMKSFLPSICAAAALAGTAAGATITIEPIKDNTIFEGTDPISNGAGREFFAGRTGPNALNRLRRALLEFDVVSAVPAGATIENVTLTLQLIHVDVSLSSTMRLYEVLAEWGEGTSVSDRGAGAVATIGDATWTYAVYDTLEWRTVADVPRPGGFFSDTVSAAADIGAAVGPYSWSDPELILDVQGWLDTPGSNHGWILLGGESGGRTARGFASRENTDPALRPKLTIEFTIPEPANAMLFIAASFSLLGRRTSWNNARMKARSRRTVTRHGD